MDDITELYRKIEGISWLMDLFKRQHPVTLSITNLSANDNSVK